MSWIIPLVCGLLAAFILGPIVAKMFRTRMPTDDEVNQKELDLHIKHLAKLNGKGLK